MTDSGVRTIAIVVAAVTLAAAQAPAPAQPSPLSKWAAVIDGHEPGRCDDSAHTIARWDLQLLEDVLKRFRSVAGGAVRLRLRGLPTDTTHDADDRQFTRADLQSWFGLTDEEAASADLSRFVLRGGVLHADAAMRCPDEHPPIFVQLFLGQPLTASARVVDGTASAGVTLSYLWRAARFVIDTPLSANSGTAAVASLRRQWYDATSAFLLSQSRLSDALEHVSQGERALPSDAFLALQSGAIHETLGSPAIQAVVDQAFAAAKADPNGPFPREAFGARPARDELGLARDAFRRALALDPAMIEAAVRLGHVQTALRDDEAARRTLAGAITASKDRLLGYFARLFLAGIEERAGHDDAAIAALREAASLYPGAQSPKMALSAILRARGALTESLTSLEPALTVPPQDRDDPWWSYDVLSGRTAGALLADLYRQLPVKRIP